jgi:hypothetical protein
MNEEEDNQTAVTDGTLYSYLGQRLKVAFFETGNMIIFKALKIRGIGKRKDETKRPIQAFVPFADTYCPSRGRRL